MHTKIDPRHDKPFRGITTIQLFDKETGKLLNEYTNENTYNSRMQYTNYIDTILSCKGPNIPNSTGICYNSTGSLLDYARPFYNTYARMSMSDSGSDTDVHQLFATLWLTNSTTQEDADGYPNGTPLGLCDAAGTAANYTSHSCCGTFNTSESYLGNDRLHLVFDFATDKCNGTFDAVWLYPSTYRYGNSAGSSYSVTTFYQQALIYKEQIDPIWLAGQTYINYSVALNDNYSVIAYGESYVGTAGAIQIFNNSTGASVSSTSLTESVKGSPLYYDASANALYVMYSPYAYSYYLLNSSYASYTSVKKIDLTTGTVTTIGNLRTLLNLSYEKADFTESTSSSYYYSLIVVRNSSGGINLLARIAGDRDGEMALYYALYSFSSSGSFNFIKDYKGKDLSGIISSRIMCAASNTLFVPGYIGTTPDGDYSAFAIDLTTGAVKSNSVATAQKSLSYERSVLCQKNAKYIDSAGDDGHAKVYYVQDISFFTSIRYAAALNGCDYCTNIQSASFNKCGYSTAPWSTHNKLTSAVTKTDMTTMKIQYDIIWDSIPDVVVPALL